MMTQKYYYAVWIDFLHGPMLGHMALNVQETNAKGDVIKLHRNVIEGIHPPTESTIVEMLLPGAMRSTLKAVEA